jgi:hypothetical protein
LLGMRCVANPKVKINIERISVFMLCIASFLSVMLVR